MSLMRGDKNCIGVCIRQHRGKLFCNPMYEEGRLEFFADEFVEKRLPSNSFESFSRILKEIFLDWVGEELEATGIFWEFIKENAPEIPIPSLSLSEALNAA